jgi:hypothetical protein
VDEGPSLRSRKSGRKAAAISARYKVTDKRISWSLSYYESQVFIQEDLKGGFSRKAERGVY